MPAPHRFTRTRLLVPCFVALSLSCGDDATGPNVLLPPATPPDLGYTTAASSWGPNLCGTIGPVLPATNGNDVLFFQGAAAQLTQTFVNAYSGETVFVDEVKNINTAVYDGLAGIDTHFMTDVGDALCLINDAGEKTIANMERIIAGDGGDIIDLSHPTIVLGNMFIDGGRNEDLMWANAGHDNLRGFDGDDNMNGGPGFDTLLGQNDNDFLRGGDGGDVLDGGLGQDILDAGALNDELRFVADATLDGSALTSNNGSPGLTGTGKVITLSGRGGSFDIFDGGDGVDVLVGTIGGVVILLWDDQRLFHSAGTPIRLIDLEVLLLQPGSDVVNLTHQLHAYGDIRILAGGGNDVIWSSSGDDFLAGGDGDDDVWSGAGVDSVYAEEGNDTIDVIDGFGHDVVFCGGGTDTVHADAGDLIDQDCETIITTNAVPHADAGGPYGGSEGAAVALSLTGSDADGDALTYTWDLGDGTTGSGPTAPASHTYADDGTYAITLTASDGSLEHTVATTVTIANVAPQITAIFAPIDPVAVNTSISLSFNFSDAGANDASWSYTIDWSDGSQTTAGTVATQGTGAVPATHTYATAGVYRVNVTITDKDGDSDVAAFEFVVVYDPSAGFVTGGGWIDSPAGAYAADPALTGRATFGLVSKYRKGATVPDGQTQFQFHAAGLKFNSTVYEWLVIAGPKGQYKGSGTIDGAGDYGFMLTVTDGQANGGGGVDRFRIKIWHSATGTVIYDNQLGDTVDADPRTALGGGSIVIHRK